MSAQIKTS